MAAALTYFTMLSLAPTLVLAIAIAGFVFEDQLAAEDEIVEQVTRFTNAEIADTVPRELDSLVDPPQFELRQLLLGDVCVCAMNIAFFDDTVAIRQQRRQLYSQLAVFKQSDLLAGRDLITNPHRHTS